MYSVSITLDNDTLRVLSERKMLLCGYKGVRSFSHSGLVSVWFASGELSNNMVITWTDQYGVYVESSSLHGNSTLQSYVRAESASSLTPAFPVGSFPDGLIASSSQPIDLGEVMVLHDHGGTDVTTEDGQQNSIGIISLKSSSWTCGILQSLGGSSILSPTCAFRLAAGEAIALQPTEVLLLEFRSDQAQAGAIVEKTTNACMLFTLSKSNPALSDVSYDGASSRWSAGGAAWAKAYPALTDIADVLIASSQERSPKIQKPYSASPLSAAANRASQPNVNRRSA